MDTEIRVSTESRPWRRKFSRRSCSDSRVRPFSYESGALTTELSPPHAMECAVKRYVKMYSYEASDHVTLNGMVPNDTLRCI